MVHNIEEKIIKWIKSRIDTRNKLVEIAAALDKVHNSQLMSKATGISLAIAGGISSLVGVLLAPSTFGLSITLTVGGTSISTIGQLTSLWGTLKNDVISRHLCKKAESLLNEHKKDTNELVKLMSKRHFRRQIEAGITGIVGKLSQEGINIANLLNRVEQTKRCGDVHNASSLLINKCKSLHFLSVALSCGFLAFECIKLVETLIELKEEVNSNVADRLRIVVSDLDTSLDDLESFVFNFNNKK